MKLTSDLPRWITLPIRILFYGMVLFILYSISTSIIAGRVQSNIGQCSRSMQTHQGSDALGYAREMLICLENKNGFLENMLMSSTSKAIKALPNNPDIFVGTWKSSQPHCDFLFELDANGEFLAKPVSCPQHAHTFEGAWGIYDNKMVWLYKRYDTWQPDINDMDVVSSDTFLLLEQNGKRTLFTRAEEPIPDTTAKEIATPVESDKSISNDATELLPQVKAASEETGIPETSATTDNQVSSPPQNKPDPRVLLSEIPPQADEAETIAFSSDNISSLPFNNVVPLPGALAISADGQSAAHIRTNGEILLWDPFNGKQLETLTTNGNTPSAVALSSDGRMLAVGYFDSRIVLWSRTDHKIVQELSGHRGGISVLAFSHDGNSFASGSNDGTARVWRIGQSQPLRVFDTINGSTVVAVDFSGDNGALFVNEWHSGQYDVTRETTLWDIDNGMEITSKDVAPPNHDNAPILTGHSVGGNGWLLAYTDNQGIALKRIDDCNHSPTHIPAGKYASTLTVDPQGRWVAIGQQHVLTFLHTNGAVDSATLPLPSYPSVMVAYPDSRHLFALIVDTTNKNYGYLSFDRSAFRIPEGKIYRITVPEKFTGQPPITINPDAVHCPASTMAHEAQNFHLPDSPAQLPVVTRLVPTEDMLSVPKAYSENDPTKIIPPKELNFNRDNHLYVFHDLGFRRGVTAWNTLSGKLEQARFTDNDDTYTWRLHKSWAREDYVNGKHVLDNLLTGKVFWEFGKEDRGCSHATGDMDTGDLYRCKGEHIERYAEDGRLLASFPIKEEPAALTARNNHLAAIDSSGHIQVWESGMIGSTTMLHTGQINPDNCVIETLTLSADGRYLQTSIACVDVDTDYPILDLKTDKVVAYGPLLSPFPAEANRGVTSESRHNHLAVRDFDREKIIARLPRHESLDLYGNYRQLITAISDDGKLVASGSYNGSVRLWNIESRQLLGENRMESPITALAFDPDGKQLAVALESGQISILRTVSEQK